MVNIRNGCFMPTKGKGYNGRDLTIQVIFIALCKCEPMSKIVVEKHQN